MNLVNEPLPISIQPVASPCKITNLASSGKLLAAWRKEGHLTADGETSFSLALHHPDHSWLAVRWDSAYGMPIQVRPTGDRIVWVRTTKRMLIRLSFEDKIGVVIAEADLELTLHADDDSLWLASPTMLKRLYINEGGAPSIVEIPIGFMAYMMKPLEDGTWMLSDGKKLFVYSSSFENVIHSEERALISYHPPFLISEEGGSLYYADDPRLGWHRIPIAANSNYQVAFFVRLGDAHYIAISKQTAIRTWLYRYSCCSTEEIELMWTIPESLYEEQFALYDDLVCIAGRRALMVEGRTDISSPHGLLIWIPHRDVFYTDILPRPSIAHTRHTIRNDIRIPEVWFGDSSR